MRSNVIIYNNFIGEQMNNPHEVKLHGKKFKSIKAVADFYNLKYLTLHRNIRRGKTLEEAVLYLLNKKLPTQVKEKKPREGTEVIVQGKTYINLLQAYEDLKPSASYNTVRMRIYKGWTGDEAFEVVQRDNKRGSREKCLVAFHQGRSWRIPELADHYGIDRTLFSTRFTNGIDVERIIELGCEKLKNVIIYDGKEYSSLLDVWEQHGENIKYSTFSSRAKKGWDLKKCLGLTEYDFYVYKGKKYNSLVDLEYVTGVKASVIAARISRGMNIDEAIAFVPKRNIGRYSDSVFKNSPKLKDEFCTLYVVKLPKDNLLKIGITTQTLDNRFNTLPFPARSMELVYSKRSKLYPAFIAEQEILSFYDLYRHKEHTFTGSTECLYGDQVDTDVLKSKLNDLLS